MQKFFNNKNKAETCTHFLFPSALFVSKSPQLVTTILGSCVAICMWDKTIRVGGINHFMLPLWNGKGLASPKYGNVAIEKLITNMIRNGCNKKNITAKIFGGGEVIKHTKPQFNIGERNITIAKEILKEENIKVIASSVGGKRGRKIIFDTYTGSVKMKFIPNNNSL